jgi:hypothetical protein
MDQVKQETHPEKVEETIHLEQVQVTLGIQDLKEKSNVNKMVAMTKTLRPFLSYDRRRF